ncbi:beta-lactamase-like protein [Crucibulum laeve]|uniref:Beta-lactamase-like protein n=1 Tax=Crucibulum laeve TaxID=68775 RepID=A0A5C3M5I9_9AGAR|nr:beta-lactamase-like protein [Crucibulum laeve]
MNSFKENEAWKEASIFEDKNPRPVKGNGGRRKAPFYKVMDGMPIAVDAFCYGTIPGVTAYFLTHAHSDHYTRLSSTWKSGPIYCSQETANLIIHILSVDKKWVHPIPMDVPTVIPDTGGVSVTLIEANHCPGSCLFLFEGRQTVHAGDSNYKYVSIGSSNLFRYLHCGDFRASPRHVLHPALKGKRIDHVYLDTTYLDPKYTFPPQPLVISACAEVAKRLFGKQKDKEDSFLVIVGTYSIGKERIVKGTNYLYSRDHNIYMTSTAIAHALNTKVFCDTRKASILKCEADAELDELLTLDPLEAIVHLVPLGSVNAEQLQAYADRFKGKYTKVIAFRPTGWTFNPGAGMNQSPTVSSILSRSQQKDFTHADLQPARSSTSALQVFPVPYSEHSSFYELTCFAMSFNWGKMIATVNVGSETSRNKMAKWFQKWQDERKKRGTDTIIDHRHVDYW